MDALELLKQDHQKVKELFEEAEEAKDKEKQEIFNQIKKELETHTRIEESVSILPWKSTKNLKIWCSNRMRSISKSKRFSVKWTTYCSFGQRAV